MDLEVPTGHAEAMERAISRTQAGTFRHDGYGTIMIYGERYLVHRLAWFYAHGCWPANLIDHIDGNPHNNAIANLRECDHRQNHCNQDGVKPGTISGLLGVQWHKSTQKWHAVIKHYGRTQSLGYFHKKEDARAARIAAEKIRFGEFARVA